MQTPCVLICAIDMTTGWCHGCGRTRDEIAGWASLTDEQRSTIMAGLSERVEQIDKKPRRITRRRAKATNPELPRATRLV